MRRARWKRKNVRDELTVEAANSPIRRSSRYGLPPKSGNLLPAALKVRKEPSASPHLEAGHLPGCKPERLSATVPCVPLRYALPCSANEQERQRKEKQRVSYLHPEASCDYQHGVQDLISSAPRPCYAGTDKSLGRTVENRISQTCACCKFGQKRLFSSTVHGAFSFPQEEKRMGGVFQ